MVKRLLLIPLFAQVMIGAGQAASPADSLTRVLQQHPARDSSRVLTLVRLADAIVYTDPASAMRHADEALDIATTEKWTKGIALALREKGNVYYVFSDNTNAMDCYMKALKV